METKYTKRKRTRKQVNKDDLESVHFIRTAYGLPCENCEYREHCESRGINKDNFVKEYRKR